MKALSVMQPWASMLVTPSDSDPSMPLKDIENRSWPMPRNFRPPQRIYVHASKNFDHDGWPEFRRLCIQSQITLGLPYEYDLGAVIGEVWIVAEIRESTSAWFSGPYGYVVRHPLKYKHPIPWRGTRRFFEIPDGEFLHQIAEIDRKARGRLDTV